MVSFAAGLTALLGGVAFAPLPDAASATSQPQVSVAQDGADLIVRISLNDVVTAHGPAPSFTAGDAFRSGDVRFGDDFARGQSGVVNIAIATGAGSIAQAATSISMNVRIAGF